MCLDMVTMATPAQKCQLSRNLRAFYRCLPMTLAGLKVMLNEELRGTNSGGYKVAVRGRFSFRKPVRVRIRHTRQVIASGVRVRDE